MASTPERISKGLLVKPRAEFKKSGGSTILIIPSDVVASMGIKEGDKCDLFRNNRGMLIIDRIEDGGPKSE